MTLRARADLVTNLTDVTNGIDMSNVTNFSTRPKILVNSNVSSDSGGDFASGTLDLLRELYQPVGVNPFYRHERYVIPATYKLVDQSNETNAKEVLEEIDRVLRVYSRNISHAYSYEFDYSVTTDRGEIFADISITMTKEYVSI